MSICFLLEISPESVENCLTVACLQCSALPLRIVPTKREISNFTTLFSSKLFKSSTLSKTHGCQLHVMVSFQGKPIRSLAVLKWQVFTQSIFQTSLRIL